MPSDNINNKENKNTNQSVIPVKGSNKRIERALEQSNNIKKYLPIVPNAQPNPCINKNPKINTVSKQK